MCPPGSHTSTISSPQTEPLSVAPPKDRIEAMAKMVLSETKLAAPWEPDQVAITSAHQEYSAPNISNHPIGQATRSLRSQFSQHIRWIESMPVAFNNPNIVVQKIIFELSCLRIRKAARIGAIINIYHFFRDSPRNLH